VTLTVGVDVGGTKVAAGVVDLQGRVLARTSAPSPSGDAAAIEDAIAGCVARLRAQHPDVSAVGVGAAGYVDAARAVVLVAPNLAWRREPLRDEVAARVGLPVVVENDANAMAWGEYRFGAGRGTADLCAVTLGTGIGGGLVLGGRLHRGTFGIGAEFGHMRFVPGGRRCGCGNRGCWEQYASGRALAREAREILEADPARGGELAGAPGSATAITGADVTAAARRGDPVALECLDVVGRRLGEGLADLAAALDPGLLVVGGGVAAAGELLLAPAREAFAAALTGRGYRPVARIVAAELGNEAGLVGAADLARVG